MCSLPEAPEPPVIEKLKSLLDVLKPKYTVCVRRIPDRREARPKNISRFEACRWAMAAHVHLENLPKIIPARHNITRKIKASSVHQQHLEN